MRRGRPRHDDVLTPREWEVLDLLRQGLTNEQIAQRLDISFSTTKFHVASIMGKLGVESRRDAARWVGAPRGVMAFAPFFALLLKLKPLKLASVGALGTAGAGFVALLTGIFVGSSGLPPGKPLPTVPVQWVQEDIPADAAPEATRPFQNDLDDDVWRVYETLSDGSTQLLFETHRYVLGIMEAPSGQLAIPFMSRYESSGAMVMGLMLYQNGDLETAWLQPEGATDVQLSSNAEHVLFHYGSPVALYSQTIGGSAYRLTGVNPLTTGLTAWSTTDDAFVMHGHAEGTSSGLDYLYMLQPEDATAITLDVYEGAANRHIDTPVWSPDGRRAAIQQFTDVVIIELESASYHRVTFPDNVTSPGGLSWSDDGRYLVYRAGVIDTETLNVLKPPEDAVEMRSMLSPDKSRLVATTRPLPEDAVPHCVAASPSQMQPNRTVLYNLDSGDETEVLGCQDGFHSPSVWLGSTHLALMRLACTGDPCFEHVEFSWTILDVASSSFTDLPGPETTRRMSITPNETLLIFGDALHEYAADGTRLRVLPSPDGRTIEWADMTSNGHGLLLITGGPVTITEMR